MATQSPLHLHHGIPLLLHWQLHLTPPAHQRLPSPYPIPSATPDFHPPLKRILSNISFSETQLPLLKLVVSMNDLLIGQEVEKLD
jgi:hypothetical protein